MSDLSVCPILTSDRDKSAHRHLGLALFEILRTGTGRLVFAIGFQLLMGAIVTAVHVYKSVENMLVTAIPYISLVHRTYQPNTH